MVILDLVSVTSAPSDRRLVSPYSLPESEPWPSIFLTRSWPSTTSPKTTCLPSSHEVTTVVMKNWDPLVLGPALAIDRRKGLLCLSWKFSSANLLP